MQNTFLQACMKILQVIRHDDNDGYCEYHKSEGDLFIDSVSSSSKVGDVLTFRIYEYAEGVYGEGITSVNAKIVYIDD